MTSAAASDHRTSGRENELVGGATGPGGTGATGWTAVWPGAGFANNAGHVTGELLEGFGPRIAVPPGQRGGLNETETERRADLVDEHRDQYAALAAFVCLFPHPVRGHRVPGPHDHDAAGSGERSAITWWNVLPVGICPSHHTDQPRADNASASRRTRGRSSAA